MKTGTVISFTAIILRFDEQGEKTGWTYIKIPAEIAGQLKPGNKKGFRVKGKLDEYAFKGMSLLPMGEGNFIMALNAAIRKAIGKRKGATVKVQMAEDKVPYKLNTDFTDCLADEPKALAVFNKMPGSHRNYYSKWIESAKTDATRAKRIAMAVDALAKGLDFGAMLRKARDDRRELGLK